MDTHNEAVGQTLKIRRNELAQTIVDRQWELYPDLDEKYGQSGYAKCIQDVSYNLSFLSEAVTSGSVTLFNNYVSWCRVLFNGLNIPLEDLMASLKITGEILDRELPPELGAITTEYIDAGLETLQNPADPEPPSFIDPEQPLGTVARDYLAALLNTERQTASRLILEEVQAGAAVKEIYLHVFQPVQREIGRLWQINQIGVAQEHFCTAATQMIMSQLYPYIFDADRNGYRLVAACVGDELHEIGIRMVADFFEMEGWDTYYLGANMPPDGILNEVATRQADFLAVSATMTFHVSAVKSLIKQIRSDESLQHVKIMVGGYPFNVDPDLWREIGADGFARDAQAAVEIARQLVETGV